MKSKGRLQEMKFRRAKCIFFVIEKRFLVEVILIMMHFITKRIPLLKIYILCTKTCSNLFPDEA